MINVIGDNVIFLSFLFIILSFFFYTIAFFKRSNLFSSIGKRSLLSVLILLTVSIVLIEFQLITKDYTQFNEYDPVVNIGSASPEEIKFAQQKAYRYYFRPKWLMKHGLNTSLRLLRNSFKI